MIMVLIIDNVYLHYWLWYDDMIIIYWYVYLYYLYRDYEHLYANMKTGYEQDVVAAEVQIYTIPTMI